MLQKSPKIAFKTGFYDTQKPFEFVGAGYYVKKTGIKYVYQRFLMYKIYQVYLNSQKTICINKNVNHLLT